MDASKLKLRRLKILSMPERDVVPGCELHFDDNINVLLGKNGTGKTTLLALLSCVARSDFSAFSAEPFGLEYDVGPDPILTVRVTNGPGIVLPPSTEAPTFGSIYPRLSIQVRTTFEGADLTVESDGIEVRSCFGDKTVADFAPGLAVPNLVLHGLWKLGLVRTAPEWILRLIQIGEPFRFDESLDAFRSMTGNPTILPGPGVPPSCSLSEENGVWKLNFVPPALILGSEVPGEGRVERDLSQVPVNLVDPASDLRDAAVLLGLAKIVWIADQPEGHRGKRQFTRFAFMMERRDGLVFPTEHLSYGQKRMLALLYYMAANPAILIADEIVNGLHHEWIAAIMSRIRDRQAFLTSQNPLLFDYLTIDSAERAGRMFVVCTSEEDEHGASRVTWRNLSPEEAARFHEDLSAGVEFPSEILLRRGLW